MPCRELRNADEVLDPLRIKVRLEPGQVEAGAGQKRGRVEVDPVRTVGSEGNDDLPVDGDGIALEFRPFEIKTLRLRL